MNVEQEQFSGKATINESRAVVTEQIVNFAAKVLGSSYYSAIKTGFSDTNTDQATRVAFKVNYTQQWIQKHLLAGFLIVLVSSHFVDFLLDVFCNDKIT